MYLRNVAISITLWVMCVEKEDFATGECVGAELGVDRSSLWLIAGCFLPS